MAPPLRLAGPCILAGIVLFAAGCGNHETIQTYTVPKTTEREAAAPSSEYRILGAPYPAENPVWYFKFAGPSETIAKHEAEFDRLSASVKLQADSRAVPTFDLPSGWVKTGSRTTSRMGITTRTDEVVKIGDASSPLEVTISYVPGGGLQQNLSRWINQVGSRANPAELGLAKPFDAAEGRGLRVDLRGAKNPVGGPMMKPH